MLQEYEAPALDPAVDEALLAYMERRKSEFEDRDY
jgi:trimethylamine--corrinoid protein Co-methyltransferase